MTLGQEVEQGELPTCLATRPQSGGHGHIRPISDQIVREICSLDHESDRVGGTPGQVVLVRLSLESRQHFD
jgi:hypothetical protein